MHLPSGADDLLPDGPGLLVGGWQLVGRQLFSRWSVVVRSSGRIVRFQQGLDLSPYGQKVIDAEQTIGLIRRDELLEGLKVRGVSQSWSCQEPVVQAQNSIEPVVLRFPLDVTVPESVRSEINIIKFNYYLNSQLLILITTNNRVDKLPEFESTSFNGPLVLLSHFVLVALVESLTVVDIVQPQVNTERYCFQALVEHLFVSIGNRENKASISAIQY